MLIPVVSCARQHLLVFCMALVVLAAGIESTRCEDNGFDLTVIDRMAESVHQVSLSEDMINRLIASQPEMRSAAQNFSNTELPSSPPTKDSAADEINALPADKREALEAIAKKYGFSSLREWSEVAASVAMSYAYALQGKQPGDAKQAVDQSIARVENDTNLTAEQRRETIARFRALENKLATLEPLKENFELVLRMKDKVTSMMDPN